MVSELQHARFEGYGEGYSRAATIYGRSIEKLRIDVLAERIVNEQHEITIAALQQSLDEATARIDANKPEIFINNPVTKLGKRKPKPKFQVGDLVCRNDWVDLHTVLRISADGKRFDMQSVHNAAVFYDRQVSDFTKVS